MKRILIIGSCGAGKSTLARRLGEALDIEVIHLDRLYWEPGWVEPRKEDWPAVVEQACTRDSWIIDGNYSGTLEQRLGACDTVIFLDLPRATCLWRVMKRFIMYRNKRRLDMADGCPEKIDLKFLAWVWGYKRRSRPKVIRLLQENEDAKEVIWLRSDGEVERFMTGLKPAKMAGI